MATSNPPSISTTEEPVVATSNPAPISPTEEPVVATSDPISISTIEEPVMTISNSASILPTEEPVMATSNPTSISTIEEPMDVRSQKLQACLKRLKKELNEFDSSAKEILSLAPANESTDLQHWEAKIQGPVDTPYENGVFILDIHFQESPDGGFYPFVPPKIEFKTKIYHPNISSKGEICMDILYAQHTPALTLEKVLLSIISLLSDPNTDDFLEPEAAYLYKENREEYDRTARECTQKYAMTAGDAAEAQESTNELNNLNDALARNIISSSSSSDQLIQQGTIDIQPSEKHRSARFSVFEPLQAKTFDNRKSKQSLLIVVQCFTHDDDPSKTNSYQMYDFNEAVSKLNMNKEIQSSVIALEEEGIKLGKQNDSEILISELCPLIDAPPDEVGQGCLRLYSMNTFLYHQLNQFLREADRTKVETYGSFVRLLYFYFNHSWSIEIYDTEVYRGMNLSSSIIDEYKKVAKSGTSFQWAAFSSTSTNRELIEHLNTNTLFIMKLRKVYSHGKKAIDISPYSEYPEEEEILLKPGVGFTVENVKYDDEKKKHYIDLNVYV